MNGFLYDLCAHLERTLYGELTWEEMERKLHHTEFLLEEAREEIAYLKQLLSQK